MKCRLGIKNNKNKTNYVGGEIFVVFHDTLYDYQICVCILHLTGSILYCRELIFVKEFNKTKTWLVVAWCPCVLLGINVA